MTPARRNRIALRVEWPGLDQLPENSQITSVQILPLGDAFGGFQDQGTRAKPQIVKQEPEGLQAHLSSSDPRMTVNPAAAFPLAVIQVPHSDPIEADGFFQLSDRFIVTFPGIQRIACGKNVARIHTDSQAMRFCRLLEDRPDLTEPVAEARPLAGCGLEVDRHRETGCLSGNDIQRGGHPLQTLHFTSSHVRPGMEHQVRNPQHGASLELNQQRFNGLFPEEIVGAGQVDQVRGVGYRIEDSGLGNGGPEGFDLFGFERGSVPLVVVFRKELDGLESDRMSGGHGAIASPCD